MPALSPLVSQPLTAVLVIEDDGPDVAAAPVPPAASAITSARVYEDSLADDVRVTTAKQVIVVDTRSCYQRCNGQQLDALCGQLERMHGTHKPADRPKSKQRRETTKKMAPVKTHAEAALELSTRNSLDASIVIESLLVIVPGSCIGLSCRMLFPSSFAHVIPAGSSSIPYVLSFLLSSTSEEEPACDDARLH